jgi:hypothetical protein
MGVGQSHDHEIESVFQNHDLGIEMAFPKPAVPFSSRDFYDGQVEESTCPEGLQGPLACIPLQTAKC